MVDGARSDAAIDPATEIPGWWRAEVARGSRVEVKRGGTVEERQVGPGDGWVLFLEAGMVDAVKSVPADFVPPEDLVATDPDCAPADDEVQTARLRVRALWEGEPRGAVDYTYRQGTYRESVRGFSAPASMEDRLVLGPISPGEPTEVQAFSVFRGGSCVELEGITTIIPGDGDNDLDITLERRRHTRVNYKLEDMVGKPIRDAATTWVSDSDSCQYSTSLTGRGDGVSDLIPWGHRVVSIDAPGFRTLRQEVVLNPGGTYTVEGIMQPTKLTLADREIKILEAIYFETGSDVILPQSFDLLNEVAATILGNNVGRVQVEGHTDDRGDAGLNMDLSQRRAESVRQYLIDRGVPADQLIAKGFGATVPITTDSSPAGRAQNRRVVFTLLDP